MIDYHKELVSALNKVLPTHYEMTLTANTKTPCISYMETNNYDDVSGNTLGYSRITYQIKLWATDIEIIQNYVKELDDALRPIGFRRISSFELYDNASSMIQKVMSYEALAIENY